MLEGRLSALQQVLGEIAPDDVGPIIGLDAMRAYLADWYEMFADLTTVPEELIDAGPGRVIVVWYVTGAARASGVPTELRFAVAATKLVSAGGLARLSYPPRKQVWLATPRGRRTANALGVDDCASRWRSRANCCLCHGARQGDRARRPTCRAVRGVGGCPLSGPA
jgi:hypothetical protein